MLEAGSFPDGERDCRLEAVQGVVPCVGCMNPWMLDLERSGKSANGPRGQRVFCRGRPADLTSHFEAEASPWPQHSTRGDLKPRGGRQLPQGPLGVIPE